MSARIVAVLGPTNTGKTHYAIERMLAHRSGVFGLPLRLLAREVYDKIVAIRGASVVALVTGEERIVPPRAAYWVCTVEAMPDNMGVECAVVDEIQLCDPFHESSLPIISGSNSDLKGAQTFTLNPSLVAAVATSLQYIPAPPLEGGYS